MVLLGSIVNALAIVIGSLVGMFFSGIPERMKVTIIQGLGMAVFVIGLSMGLKATTGGEYDLLIVIISLVVGGVLGEVADIEGKLEAFGKFAERKMSGIGNGKVAEAFVFSTLIYCVGAMAIVGSLESGMQGVHKILFTKALLDGFSAIFFTSAMGIGIAMSAIPVFLYQGSIALMAMWLSSVLSEPIIAIMSATGGMLIMGIALNAMEIKKINVGNLLPAIFVAAIIKWVAMIYGY